MQYLYKQFVPNCCMQEASWKCYRCNLSFKDESVANMHKQISNHSVSKEKIQIA